MIRVFDYLCPNGHRHEMFVQADELVVPCPTCGNEAVRQLSAPRAKLDSASGDFPGATIKWENDRYVKMASEKKRMADHGEYSNGAPVGDGCNVKGARKVPVNIKVHDE